VEGGPLVAAVRATVARHRLLAPGDRVLVAVSGGPDSVALLHALICLQPDHGLTLVVCHVDHGLRAEADRDAALVRELAGRLGCPAVVERVVVRCRPGRSPESAARDARYAALERVARECGATRIALGHTADDQAETVLMRLVQGAGPRGLAGIPVRRGRLVRPLLDVDRAAVLAHLARHDLPSVEDSTNQDVTLLRNRVRREVLPLLAAHGWPRIGPALRRSAAASRELVEALDALLGPRVAALVRPGLGGVWLDLAPLRGLPPGAVKAALRLALVDVARRPEVRAGLRAPHLDQLAGLLDAPAGARVRLPGGLVVERARAALWVARVGEPAAPIPLVVPGETDLPAAGCRVRVDLGGPAPGIPGPWEAWLDADVLRGPLLVRPRRPAERVVPFGADRHVRVAGLLAAAGTPRAARGAWPLLVAAGPPEEPTAETVLWVIGVRRAAAAPITPETKTMVRVRVEPDLAGRPREDAT
jgi:tRNA(Ile)-lysidine synthase